MDSELTDLVFQLRNLFDRAILNGTNHFFFRNNDLTGRMIFEANVNWSPMSQVFKVTFRADVLTDGLKVERELTQVSTKTIKEALTTVYLYRVFYQQPNPNK